MQIMRAEDFNRYTDDALRDRWTKAQLEAVITTFQGKRVHLETDKRLGHVVDGVELVAVVPARGTGWNLRYRHFWTEGEGEESQLLAAHLSSLGVIIANDFGGKGKYDALHAYNYYEDPWTEVARRRREEKRASRAH